MRSARPLLALLLTTAIAAGAVSPAGAGASIRKDVKDMTAQEKQDYVDAVLALKKVRAKGKRGLSLYDAFVFHHREVGSLAVDGAHSGPAFLPWHREFLHAFEATLIRVSGKPDLALPYWDWTNPASTAAVFGADFMGGTGVPSKRHAVMNGPFRRGRWKINVPERVGVQGSPFASDRGPFAMARTSDIADNPFIQRDLGGSKLLGVTSLPAASEMDRIMAITQYDSKPFSDQSDARFSFRCALEGWGRPANLNRSGGHNQVHLWVGGLWKEQGVEQLGTISGAASPNDPVFWLVHSNIERLWTRWQQTNGLDYEPAYGAKRGHNRNGVLAQLRPLGIQVSHGHATMAAELRPADLLDPAPLQVAYQDPLR